MGILEAMGHVADGNEAQACEARIEAIKLKIYDDLLFRLNRMKNGLESLYDPDPEPKQKP